MKRDFYLPNFIIDENITREQIEFITSEYWDLIKDVKCKIHIFRKADYLYMNIKGNEIAL
jgi:hypothetical protein